MTQTISVIILQSAIGDEERALQWTAFQQKFHRESSLNLVETDLPENADFVFLATGGVEHLYAQNYKSMPRAIYAPKLTNAFAAMNEIRGFLAKHGENAFCFDSSLISLDDFARTARAKRLVDQAALAVFGAPAPWLIASYPNEDAFKAHFKTQIRFESWDELHWPDHAPTASLAENWRKFKQIKVDEGDLNRACQLSSAMVKWAEENRVDAISVGCFPLLASHVSACLAVSDLLDSGRAAACENDICAAMAMLIVLKLGICKQPPWMANLVDIRSNLITLHHCTIGKSCLRECTLMTHFESGANVAVAGTLEINTPVTIFRFNDDFSKAYIDEGTVTFSGPNTDGCRTAAEVKLDHNFPQPLGNHHILIPGRFAHIIRQFCLMMNISVL